MRKYSDDIKKELAEIYCNKCGKKIITDKGIIKEGVFSITYGWGYFSRKDGETHSLDLCEDCYDELIKTFKLPINIVERNEIV